MIELPIWNDCRHCRRIVTCPDSFPPDGQCPHPNDHLLGPEHPVLNGPCYLMNYEELLQEDVTSSAIYQRWELGLLPNDADFLHLREQSLHPCYWEQTDAPMFLLRDILGLPLTQMLCDYGVYYSTEDDSSQVSHIPDYSSPESIEDLRNALGLAVFATPPDLLTQNALLGSDWTRLLLDQVRMVLWTALGCQQWDLDSLGSENFRTFFEREWLVLMTYQNSFYGFRVLPKLKTREMVRYQELPYGDKQIRHQISTYFAHQATEYPHLLTLHGDNQTETLFEEGLRRMYDPLLRSFTQQALDNLLVEDVEIEDAQSARLLEDIGNQVEEEYRQARQQFSFYLENERRKTLNPLGQSGFLSYPCDDHEEATLDALLQVRGYSFSTRDVREVSFATYLRQRLRGWLIRTHPAYRFLRDDVSLQTPLPTQQANNYHGGNQTLEDILAGEQSVWDSGQQHLSFRQIIHNDIGYLTIRQVAQVWGLSEHQLRRLDRQGQLKACRVRDLFEPPYPLNLKPDARLYAATEETRQSIELLKIRLSKHSTHLQSRELDRKTAAFHLNTNVNTLRKLEKQGLVQPLKRGRVVVYDENTLSQAEVLIKQNQQP